MCGFFFYISKNNLSRKHIKLLDISSNLLKHRGPDNNKKFIEDNIYARFYRLKILDVKDRSNQPFFSKDKRYMLLFNGEIYNFKSLKEELKKNYDFKTTSDTEVLLAAFIKYKENLTKKISGMFAFVIYDFKFNKVYFFRDPFGQKTIYYQINKDSLIISSEIKPIVKLKETKLDDEEIKNYFLTNNYGYKKKTLFKNIFQVQSGQFAKIKLEQRVCKKISLKNYVNRKKIVMGSSNINHLNKNLDLLVKEHAISDVKIGLALSSGLDSRSLYIALKKNNLHKKLNKVFFITFDDFKFEEKEVSDFCKKFKLNLKVIRIKKETIVKNFEKCIYYNEAPIGGIMNIAMFKLCDEARKNNIKVLIGGYGLDEILGGYDILNPNITDFKINNYLIDGTIINNNIFLKKNKTKIKPYVYHSNVNKNQLVKNVQLDLLFKKKIPRTVHMIDRFSMTSSIEFRNPYLDFNFAEYCLGLKAEKYFKKNLGKMPMRHYMKKIEKNINWFETKISVQSPQDKWIKGNLFHSLIKKIMTDKIFFQKANFLSKKKIEGYFLKIKKNQLFTLPIWQLINIYYMYKIFK